MNDLLFDICNPYASLLLTHAIQSCGTFDLSTMCFCGTVPPRDQVGQLDGGEESIPAVNPSPQDPGKWQATLETVISSVVSIHFSRPRPFDTDLSTCSQATGFVVDAEKGYILTNRHVVCPGPFTGYCVFDNHEEVSTYIRTFSSNNS